MKLYNKTSRQVFCHITSNHYDRADIEDFEMWLMMAFQVDQLTETTDLGHGVVRVVLKSPKLADQLISQYASATKEPPTPARHISAP